MIDTHACTSLQLPVRLVSFFVRCMCECATIIDLGTIDAYAGGLLGAVMGVLCCGVYVALDQNGA